MNDAMDVEGGAGDASLVSGAYKFFEGLPAAERAQIICDLLAKGDHKDHLKVYEFLTPMLKRDFVDLLANRGFVQIASHILYYLDPNSLYNAQFVSKTWYNVILGTNQWKKAIEHNVRRNSAWYGICKKREIMPFLFKDDCEFDVRFFARLYPLISEELKALDGSWREGKPKVNKIVCQSETSKGVYCLQYDDDKIVSGLRDNTIKIWDIKTTRLRQTLKSHSGSVLCLQYDDKIIVSGSSDSSIKIWDVTTGANLHTIKHHTEAVLHLRFHNGIMVTCSKDRYIAVWHMTSPTEINLHRRLTGHRAAVNVVDFDMQYIVSASGDRTIRVWDTNTCEFVRTMSGHRRGIACLQYRDKLVVSGSSDNSIRIWDVETGQCLKQLEGHDELVRCIRFDLRRIVSGAYDGRIKVWDLRKALNSLLGLDGHYNNDCCISTLHEHTGRVFRLQFDDFQIVSSSHDDTIIIWDFLQPVTQNSKLVDFLRPFLARQSDVGAAAASTTSLSSTSATAVADAVDLDTSTS